jgi:hypothetical protein
MPEFTTVSVQEAKLRTIPGRQGRFLNEYVAYIQQVASGQAGKLHPVEQENPLTIRRRFLSAAQALGTNLAIKQSGEDVYFWKEDGAEEELRSRQTRRADDPGGKNRLRRDKRKPQRRSSTSERRGS